MPKLSTILTHLMSEKGISSAELARKTGITQPAIYRLMTGETENPQILTLKPIVNYFGISFDQLLGSMPLNTNIKNTLDDTAIHNMNTKLSTIKMIASVLYDLLPILIEGYQKAVTANSIKENISPDVLSLLILNTATLLKTATLIQKILTSTNPLLQE